jgi:agmatine deiminase
MQPEWARHERVWIGFPHDRSEWPEADFDSARGQIAAFAAAVADDGRGEQVDLIVNDAESEAAAGALLTGSAVAIRRMTLGDVWLRDTAPIISGSGASRAANDFAFNGWGGKFTMTGDEDIAERLAAAYGIDRIAHDWVLEGGAIDVDGSGLGVTTEQCLRNPNRNARLTRQDIEQRLRDTLGITSLLWLGDGLEGDHTDGHVDNLARFVGRRLLLLPIPNGADDPNAQVYSDARVRADQFGVEVVTMPSPGRIEVDGDAVPASYMNFYIGNTVVVVPQYGVSADGIATDTMAGLFPDRRIVGLPSNAILRGGGSFHCCSQQVPE